MGDEYSYRPSVGQSGPKAQPDNRSEQYSNQSLAYWSEAVREGPVQRLRYLYAKLARANPDERERIKSRSAELIREAGAEAAMSDPHIIELVRELFGAPGVDRLRHRTKNPT